MRAATGGCDGALLVQVPDWTAEAAAEALGRRIAAGGLDFTAVLAAGDSLALGAARALAERRIPVPQAVSVMGMDGLPQTAFHRPPLSVVEIPMREIGAAAVDLLCEQVQSPGRAARRVELGCRLVPRVSTGRAVA
jgi:DNA-binding LacI/PurR family transcriptional regulator